MGPIKKGTDMQYRSLTARVGLSLIVISASFGAIYAQKYTCLPAGMKADAVVGADPKTHKLITVAAALKKIKARCSHGSLVDRKGRKIKFFELQGCWGNPPADYLEILEQQKLTLEKLKKKYTVIEIPCTTNGRSISSTDPHSIYFFIFLSRKSATSG